MVVLLTVEGVEMTDIPDSRRRGPSGVGLGAGKRILGHLILEQGGHDRSAHTSKSRQRFLDVPQKGFKQINLLTFLAKGGA